MDNVTFITDFRQRNAEKDKAKQEDARIDKRATLIYEGWYSDLPEDVRAKRREELAELDKRDLA